MFNSFGSALVGNNTSVESLGLTRIEPAKWNKVNSSIYSILFPSSSSVEYVSYVADIISFLMYRDVDIHDILMREFDHRYLYGTIYNGKIKEPGYKIAYAKNCDVSIETSSTVSNIYTETVKYHVQDTTDNNLMLSSSLTAGNALSIPLRNIASGKRSSWTSLSDSGAKIIVTCTDVQAPDLFFEVYTPFTWNLSEALSNIMSIDGVTDLVFLAAQEYKELSKIFLSNDRMDKKLWAIILSHVLSIK